MRPADRYLAGSYPANLVAGYLATQTFCGWEGLDRAIVVFR